MNIHGLSKNVRISPRAGALVLGLLLTACSSAGTEPNAGSSAASSALGAAGITAQGPRLSDWRKAITKVASPKDGCFEAAYPSLTWEEVPCGPAPANPVGSPRPQLSDVVSPVPTSLAHAAGASPKERGPVLAPFSVGNGNDYFAQFSGPIYEATGSFPTVTGSPTAGAYSIQLNTNGFNTPAGTSVCSGCVAWQQGVYSTSQGTFIEYWLFGLSSCPSGWTSAGGGCFINSSNIAAPTVPIGDLQSMRMEMFASTSDTLTMTVQGTAYRGSFGSVLGLNQNVWNHAEFGVYGDAGGSGVTINGNTTITVHIDGEALQSGSCSTNAQGGATGEYNNLSELCCLSNQGGQPGIAFQMSNVAGQSCTLCGGEGQACCSIGSGCASAGDVCYDQTCVACGGNDEPCCAGNSCTAAGNVCQLGACGQPNVLVASPSSLSVQVGDGVDGINTATTYLKDSGYWANDPYTSPSLVFTTTSVPAGAELPPSGAMPAGVSWAITDDSNPPTVQMTAGMKTVPGTYTFAITGTIDKFQATANLILTCGACQPVTCAAAGWTCGSIDNGCGATVTCGTCASGQECTAGVCHTACARYCPPPQFLDPFTCTCQSCRCGTLIVHGHTLCRACRP